VVNSGAPSAADTCSSRLAEIVAPPSSSWSGMCAKVMPASVELVRRERGGEPQRAQQSAHRDIDFVSFRCGHAATSMFEMNRQGFTGQRL